MSKHQGTAKMTRPVQRILLVDDDEMVRNTTKEILKYLGYEVTVACGGEEAIEIYKNKKNQIDLLIIDLIMPKMNGVTCFESLKKLDPKVPVIISSGISEISKKESILQMGVAAFIQKPFTIDVLQSTLSSL
ncbi:MAG TPA: response regulator [Calditrichaeota bacterium]|nr:response regulator [Calditrichota bacterium]